MIQRMLDLGNAFEAVTEKVIACVYVTKLLNTISPNKVHNQSLDLLGKSWKNVLP
jgi:hypothetical protein